MAQQPAEVASTIASHHDHHTQMSTIQGLEVASANQIPIPIVDLFECFPTFDESVLKLNFKNGLSISVLTYLHKLMIHDADRKLTNEEWSGILSYSAECTRLKMLMFNNYRVPETPIESIPISLRARNVKVSIMQTVGFLIFTCRLDLETGEWQASDKRGILPGEEGFDPESYQRSLERFNIMTAANQ